MGVVPSIVLQHPDSWGSFGISGEDVGANPKVAQSLDKGGEGNAFIDTGLQPKVDVNDRVML